MANDNRPSSSRAFGEQTSSSQEESENERTNIFYECNIANLFIQPQNVDIHGDRTSQKPPSTHATEKFLRKCQKYLDKMLEPKKELNLDSRVTLKILDMGDCEEYISVSNARTNADTFFGHDHEPIEDFSKIHTSNARHVMILGDAGAGKTTLSKMYSDHARARGKISTHENIELIHYVNAFQLNCKCKSTAFDLFFTQQLAAYPETELSEEEQRAGMEWVQKNQKTLLITIDGLDQCRTPVGGEGCPNITYETGAECNVILASIMAGKLWHNAYVLTTSRWSVYWNLSPEQKPDKVIGLRGLDDSNLQIAAKKYIPDTTTSAVFIDKAQSQDFCRNPLFLKYAVTAFKRDNESLPDSISGLLSSVFTEFVQLRTRENPDLANLTKLAYNGMNENRFEFSFAYLKKLEIKPKSLEDFLHIGTYAKRGQPARDDDKVYRFTHPIMQEYCAALHIVNISEAEAQNFIASSLNKSTMEMTRNFLYGVMLNDSTTQLMKRYIDDRKCSIEKCREMLRKQLRELIPNGIIRDIRLITLLNECGGITVEEITPHIKYIHMNIVDLPKNDQLALASMIKQCSPHLAEVYVREFWLGLSLLDSLKRCQNQDNAMIFQAGYEAEDSIDEAHVDDVIKLFEHTKLLFVMLHSRDDVKDIFLKRWIDKDTVDFGCIGLINVNKLGTLKLLFRLVEKSSFRELKICLGENISKSVLKEELPKQRKNENNLQFMVRRIRISDKSLTKEKVNAYIALLQRLGSTRLIFYWCDLQPTLITEASKACRERDIYLESIGIWDSSLAVEGFDELASMMKATNCRNVLFGHCDLDEAKLSRFGERCSLSGLVLDDIHIRDVNMTEDVYGALARTIKATRCRELSLDDCGLTRNKVMRLQEKCQTLNAQLSTINIWDSSMPPDGFREVALLIRATECKELYLGNCDITQPKLDALQKCCEENGITIANLSIKDRLTILESNGPNFTHMHGFKIVKQSQISCGNEVEESSIARNATNEQFVASEEVVSAICELMKTTVSHLEIVGWVIDDEAKAKMEKIVLESRDVKVTSLKLPGNDVVCAQSHEEI